MDLLQGLIHVLYVVRDLNLVRARPQHDGDPNALEAAVINSANPGDFANSGTFSPVVAVSPRKWRYTAAVGKADIELMLESAKCWAL